MSCFVIYLMLQKALFLRESTFTYSDDQEHKKYVRHVNCWQLQPIAAELTTFKKTLQPQSYLLFFFCGLLYKGMTTFCNS